MKSSEVERNDSLFCTPSCEFGKEKLTFWDIKITAIYRAMIRSFDGNHRFAHSHLEGLSIVIQLSSQDRSETNHRRGCRALVRRFVRQSLSGQTFLRVLILLSWAHLKHNRRQKPTRIQVQAQQASKVRFSSRLPKNVVTRNLKVTTLSSLKTGRWSFYMHLWDGKQILRM